MQTYPHSIEALKMSTHSKVAGKAVLDLSAKIGDDRGSTSPSTTDSSSISSSYSFGRSDSDNVNSRPRRRSRVQSMSHKSKGAQDFFGTTPPPSPSPLIRNVSGSGTPKSQDFFGASDDTPPSSPLVGPSSSVGHLSALPLVNMAEIDCEDVVETKEKVSLSQSCPLEQPRTTLSDENENLKPQSMPEDINSGKVNTRCQCNIM